MEKIFVVNGAEVKVQDFVQGNDFVEFTLKGKLHRVSMISKLGHETVLDNGSRLKASVGTPNADGEAVVMVLGREAVVSIAGKAKKKSSGPAGGLASPMPGKIFKILKEVGSEVKKGEAILILEAMKMEHSIRSDKDGKVKKIAFKVGELVQGGVTLAEVE